MCIVYVKAFGKKITKRIRIFLIYRPFQVFKRPMTLLRGTLLGHNVVALYVLKVLFQNRKDLFSYRKEKEKRMTRLKCKIDTGALDGLRGLAALHVMFGHWT